jgi:bacillithiol biosynthesis deacetylase BshB1
LVRVSVDVLAIVAHPDDAELLCGGTLARAAQRGQRTGILDLTRGELGSAGTPELRAGEAAEAARILGVAERVNAGLPDGALEATPAARRVVAMWLRRLRPRLVITHWPDARHPDHAAAAQLARSAGFLAGLKKYDVEGEPHRPHKLMYSLVYQESWKRPTFVVDITDQMETKLNSIFAFASQFTGKSAMGDVRAGGDRPLREQILALHSQYGSWIRTKFGEPFWTREVVRMDDPLAQEVGSF